MPRMIYTEGFLDDAALIYSDRVMSKLSNALNSIEAFPQIGSQMVPSSIKSLYGGRVRKVVVAPFDLVYEYIEDEDAVIVYGLVPFRSAS